MGYRCFCGKVYITKYDCKVHIKKVHGHANFKDMVDKIVFLK